MANPSQQKTLLIVALTSVLAGLLLFITILGQNDQAQQALRILLPADTADSIRISMGDQVIKIEKNKNEWRLTQPVDTPANEQRVKPLLSLLVLPGTTRYAASDVNLHELGLEPPLARLTINGIVFDFGKPATGEHKRYMAVQEGIYLIDDIVFPLISGGVAAFTASTAKSVGQ